MNILVINGSPRGDASNSIKLTHAFIEGAGWTYVNVMNISKMNVKPCLGCYACWNKTPGICVQNDDMGEFLSTLIASHIIIWSFPLYYYGIPGSLKNLVDRQLPLNLPLAAKDNEPDGGHPQLQYLAHQRHIVISTGGFLAAGDTFDAVTAMFNHYYGEGKYVKIFFSQGELFRVPELKGRTDTYLEIVRRAGKEFSGGGISAGTQAELFRPLYPQDAYEKIALDSWGIAKDDSVTPEDGLASTTQMASRYKPDGKNRVLEISYTDINKTYQLLLTENGAEVITENFKKYTTRIETPLTVWRSINLGKISGQEALFQRRYRVLGDFNFILHWDELFISSASKSEKPAARKWQRKPNILLLQLPWIVLWVLMVINLKAGAVAGILMAASLPLLWLAFTPVIYEQLSVLLLTGLSLAVFLGAGKDTVILTSYWVFGLLWLISTFTKIPLTAYYSANYYGEERALSDRLFLRTNRIITAAWGILFLLTPSWTSIFINMKMKAFAIIINCILPAILGILTVLFVKWYPVHWAGKNR